MRVQQMETNGGNKVNNQFIIKHEGTTTFQSYNSTICIINHTENTLTFGVDWDFSRTTMKYLHQFLLDNTFISPSLLGAKNIRIAIKAGTIVNGRFGSYTVIYKEELN